MAKKNFTYSIEKEVEKELDHVANNVVYRSKSSIVQEAIQMWLKTRNKPSKEGIEWAKSKIEEKYGEDG